MAPPQIQRIAAPSSASIPDRLQTKSSTAMSSPLADPNLTQLRARLDVSTETEASAVFLQYQVEALRHPGNVDQYLVRLASIFEEYGFGPQKDLAAHSAKRRRAKLVKRLKSAWPEEIVDHYAFRNLATSALELVVRIAAWHEDASSERSNKQLAWTFAAVELNRAMLYRDSDWRGKQRYSPNVGQLIGQHHSQSKIQDPERPLETQDFRKALQSVHISLLQKMKHKSWDWGRGKTWEYLKLHSLGFDQHGILVRATGRLDGDLMERFLLPKLPTTTSEQAIVLRSPSMNASFAVDRPCVASCNDPAQKDGTTDQN